MVKNAFQLAAEPEPQVKVKDPRRVAAGKKATALRKSEGGLLGFASMDPQRQREIAAMGGKAAHQLGTAHQFTSEEAKRASLSRKNIKR